MKPHRLLIALCSIVISPYAARCDEAPQPPLKLIKTIPVPGLKEGDWDHMCVDLDGMRLFSVHETNQTVEVFDLKTDEHIGSFGKGILTEPHSMAYRRDLKQLVVVDGNREMGGVRIFDASTPDYKLVKSVVAPIRVDWSGYDPATKILYMNNNGRTNKTKDSFAVMFDTDAGEIIGSITVHDDVITDFQLETENANMYTTERNKKKIAVIDRNKREQIAEWPMTLGEGMGHMGLDRTHHRLFVNCRYGQMVIFDTQTGKEIGAIAINQYSDELYYDQARQRIYIMASGAVGVGHASIEAFQQIDPDHYKSLGELPTGTDSRNGIFVPELNKIYVSVPKSKDGEAKILVFKVL